MSNDGNVKVSCFLYSRMKNYRWWVAILVSTAPLLLFMLLGCIERALRLAADLIGAINPGSMRFKCVNKFSRWVNAGNK